mmetsp:Transcript_4519/g.13405  ORF Transcript_4519/g.13405 Transcript_4519/m.13405 type:complete len:284 (-) Transcript_4519:1-852(-)
MCRHHRRWHPGPLRLLPVLRALAVGLPSARVRPGGLPGCGLLCGFLGRKVQLHVDGAAIDLPIVVLDHGPLGKLRGLEANGRDPVVHRAGHDASQRSLEEVLQVLALDDRRHVDDSDPLGPRLWRLLPLRRPPPPSRLRTPAASVAAGAGLRGASPPPRGPASAAVRLLRMSTASANPSELRVAAAPGTWDRRWRQRPAARRPLASPRVERLLGGRRLRIIAGPGKQAGAPERGTKLGSTPAADLRNLRRLRGRHQPSPQRAQTAARAAGSRPARLGASRLEP